MAQRGTGERELRPSVAGQTDNDHQVTSRSIHSAGAFAADVHVTGANNVVELAELPLLLTIRQAAKVLDVCPAKAYEMAHRFETTGVEGLPVIRLDRLYRVPRWAFAVLVLIGRVVTLAELEAHRQQVDEQSRDQRAAIPTSAVVEPEAATPSRSSGRPAARRVRRSSGRPAGEAEQLRLLPGD